MKNKLPLVIAIVFGVAAVLTIRAYVNKAEQKAQAAAKGNPVVAARMEIPPGAELRKEMLAFIDVPQRIILRQAFGSAEVNQLLGRKTAVRIQAGQPILASDLAGEAAGGFSTVIPAGEGAFSVTIAKGIKPGLIQASDHVDIMASFALPKGSEQRAENAATWRQGSDMVNVVLLQNVTVLAVGETFGGAARTEGGGGAELTLALKLQEAQTLMFAAQHGELGAMLRRDGSTDVKNRTELPRVTFQDIEKIIGDLDTRRIVEVQSGPGKERKYPVSTNSAK